MLNRTMQSSAVEGSRRETDRTSGAASIARQNSRVVAGALPSVGLATWTFARNFYESLKTSKRLGIFMAMLRSVFP
jgi:hypothetical protein